MHTHAAIAVVPAPGCGGLGLKAQRALQAGDIIHREVPPVAILRASALCDAFQSDPVIQALLQPRAPTQPGYGDDQWWSVPTRASIEVIDRFAQLEFDKLPPLQQQKWMSLVDSFSTPPLKTPGGVFRSNAFTDVATGDNYLYEVLCRANHSCAPNIRRSFVGDMAVVTALRDVDEGEPSWASYSGRHLPPPTRPRLLTSRPRVIRVYR